MLACARNYAALWLRHKNPFIDHTQEPSGDTAVLTFEVAFADVVGMDFRWPLTDEPRLVLEASCLCKRVFHSVSSRMQQHGTADTCNCTAGTPPQGLSSCQEPCPTRSCQQQHLLNCMVAGSDSLVCSRMHARACCCAGG